jgi:hypothetical protein
VIEHIGNVDPEVDFTVFRELWTGCDEYNPYLHLNKEYQSTIGMLEGHLAAEEYAEACELCTATFGKCLVNLKWNMRCEPAYKGLGDAPGEKLHDYMVKGLIKSIMNSGDGAGTDSAYKVISYLEQSAVYAVLGCEAQGQRLVIDGGTYYDIIKVKDKKTGELKDRYFDVSHMMGLKDKKE